MIEESIPHRDMKDMSEQEGKDYLDAKYCTKYVPTPTHFGNGYLFHIWEAFTCLPKGKIWHEHLRAVAFHTLGYDLFKEWERIGVSEHSMSLPFILLDPKAYSLLDVIMTPFFGYIQKEDGLYDQDGFFLDKDRMYANFVDSKSKARQMLKEGAVYVNDVKVTDEKYQFSTDPEGDNPYRNDFVFPGIFKLSCGKKFGVRNSVICTWH